MNLILLRPGKAADHHADGDFSRALVDKGRKQARRVAKLLKAAGVLPDIVLTSPVLRCLKQQLGAEIHFLTKRAFAAVVEPNPYVDHVFTFEKEVTDEEEKQLEALKGDLEKK